MKIFSIIVLGLAVVRTYHKVTQCKKDELFACIIVAGTTTIAYIYVLDYLIEKL